MAMESILTLDLKNNDHLLEDFEGLAAGDKIVVEACYLISELSENRLNAPLEEVYSIKPKEEDAKADKEDEEDDEGEGDSPISETY
jgi:hypothetical protein